MNRLTLATLSMAALMAIGSTFSFMGQPAEARHGINDRQERQQRRIYNGVRSGDLNRREAARLSRQQIAFNRRETRFRNSGNGLNRSERARLHRQQNHLSNNIYGQRHDNNVWGRNNHVGGTLTLEQRNRMDPSQRQVNRQIYGR